MSYKILIADDDLEDLELIEEAIITVEPEAELHKFTNGFTAMEYLNSRQDSELPCLIILDYNMPELNGSQWLSYVKNQTRYNKIPKIVLSTSNAPSHIQECISSGAAEYIVKPDTLKELQSIAYRLVAMCRKSA
ncbi:response regulator [Chitinophaga filiformis]|uniref:response regulator n=1 Tax=Chitinophaga filiformis TaxID=104663 RepID=UPI001F193B2C|nr:response regulator [Chitinophaga filiformis]MCF6407338.1 response regulator [Chitinophaga filiformis]